MPLVSETIQNVFGGVSQQPPEQRDVSRSDDEVNTYAVWGRSLMRRPPLVYLAKLLSTADAAATVIPITTADGNRFFAAISGGTVRVFDAVTGVEKTISNVVAQTYLSGATAGYRWTQVGDALLIANRSTTVKSGGTKTPAKKYEALVWVRQGDYDTKYTITLNGLDLTYTSPTSSAVNARRDIATDAIAANLLALVPNINTVWTGRRFGSTVYLSRVDGADFTLRASDGLADLGLVAIKGTAQRFTDLPPKAKAGVLVEITGDDSSSFDNYYVQFDDSASPGENGVWKEVPAPDSVSSFDVTTLPHQLVWKGRFLDETKAAGPYVNPPTEYDVAGNQMQVDLGDYKRYPLGTTITIAVTAGPTWSYTVVAADDASATIAASLVASIAGTAGWTAGVIWSPGARFVFGKTPAALFTATVTVTGWDKTKQAHLPTMVAVTNQHVGRIIQNLTDGSSGTITSNGVTTITCSAGLSGGVDNEFDPNDRCVIVGTGEYFTFSRPPWTSRVAGDDITAPFVSFLGRTISDLFVHKNRLGFTSKDAVILSRVGDFFNFFRQTATQILPDDLIDVRSALPGTPDFHAALNWNNGLYLWTEKTQLELVGDPILSPQTVQLKLASAYENTKTVRPKVAGDRLFFIGLKNKYPRLMDYHTVGNDRTLIKADDVTELVPSYLTAGNPAYLAVDGVEGVVIVGDSLRPASLHAYCFAYDGDQPIQRSWRRWEFPLTMQIVAADANAGVLAIVASHPDGLYLYNTDLDPVRLAAALRYNGQYFYDGTETYSSPNP